MGRRADVDAPGFDDEQAVAWMRSAECILFPTNEAHPLGKRMLACRNDVKRLRARLEAADVAPALIVVKVRALIVERGYLEMVEAFVDRPPVQTRTG